VKNRMFELKKNPCANCGEEIDGEIILHKGNKFCSENCRINWEAMFNV